MLRSDAVSLRAPQRGDAEVLYKMAQDFDLSQLTSPYWRPWSLTEFMTLLSEPSVSHSRAVADEYRFVLVQTAVREVPIGLAEIHRIDWRNGTAEIGIAIWPEDARRRGYGGAAVSLLCDWAFGTLRLRRLQARVLATNEPSQKLFCRLGFIEEGRLRGAFYVAGNVVDIVVYGLMANEWQVAAS